jgi:hypothetical protein
LYAHVIACTGWTWDYISEHVDLPRLESMNRYWEQFPPLHVMVAAYFGITPKKQQEPASVDELLAMFPVTDTRHAARSGEE